MEGFRAWAWAKGTHRLWSVTASRPHLLAVPGTLRLRP